MLVFVCGERHLLLGIVLVDTPPGLLMIKLYENLEEQQKQQGQLNVAIALNHIYQCFQPTEVQEQGVTSVSSSILNQE